MAQFTNENVVTGAVDVNNFPAVQDVDVTATVGLTDAQLRATPVPVSVSGTVATTVGGSALATVSSIVVNTTVATLSASNAAKTKVIVHNEGGVLYVKLGDNATNADYSYRLTANTMLEITGYTGIVTGIKQTGTTNAQVTEVGI